MKKIMNHLLILQKSAQLETFLDIFGENSYQKIWETFNNYERNIIDLYAYLKKHDPVNEKKLLDYLYLTSNIYS